MITPALKDKILEYLVLNATDLYYTSTDEELAQQFEISDRILTAILKQFHERKFINYKPYMGGGFFLDITADAHDYILRGGHLGEFEFLERQAEKLERELASLQSVAPKETYDNMKGIIDTMLAAASTYKAFNP